MKVQLMKDFVQVSNGISLYTVFISLEAIVCMNGAPENESNDYLRRICPDPGNSPGQFEFVTTCGICSVGIVQFVVQEVLHASVFCALFIKALVREAKNWTAGRFKLRNWN